MKAIITRKIIFDDCQEWNGDNEQDKLEFERGDWHLVGVIAQAKIFVPYGKDYIIAYLNSPGLWGIQSHSGEDYFNEVFAEETHSLIAAMQSSGVKYEIQEAAA